MENGNLDCYRPIEIALKGVGLKVDEIDKQDRKTVITVSPYEEGDKGLVTLEERWEGGQ